MASGNLETFDVRKQEAAAGGHVAYVTIDNVSKKNALSTLGRGRLAEIMNELARDDALRVVVLTGAGDEAFIGGAHIGEMGQFPNANVAELGSRNTHLACDSIRRMPVPVIARIAGYCLGAGMEIAAACDMRVSAQNGVFGMPEVKYGLPSGMEACLLPLLIGWGKARELVYTGEMIDAQEAHRVGFVDRLVPLADLDAATQDWVASICAAGPRAIRLQKELIRDWERMSIADAVQQGIRAIGDAHSTDEPRRMIAAYHERRRRKREASVA